jgi:hypothetical protein
MLGRRASVATYGYRALRVAQDYDLWLRMAASNSVRLRRDVRLAVAYRIHDRQISATQGYSKRVQGSPEIRESWQALFEALKVAVDVQGEPLKNMLKRMRHANRLYYGRLLRRYGSMVDPADAGPSTNR